MLGIKSTQLETNRGVRLHTGTQQKEMICTIITANYRSKKDLVVRGLTLVGEDLKKVRSSFQASR